jgi:hypothetical protein
MPQEILPLKIKDYYNFRIIDSTKMNMENKINITFKEGPKVEITGAENHTYEVRFVIKKKK